MKKILEELGELHKVLEEYESKKPFDINLLKVINVNEPQTSKIIENLFKYKKEGKHIILEKFVKEYISKDLEISKPEIYSEKWFSNGKIDILVCEKNKYAIIIENKIKNAHFQPQQLGKYISSLIDEGYKKDNIYVIVMPKYPSKEYFEYIEESFWNDPNSNDKNYKSEFQERTKIIPRGFADWIYSKDLLKEIRDNEKELKHTLKHFSDYLKHLYGMEENKELEEVLLGKEEDIVKWKKLEELLEKTKKLNEKLQEITMPISTRLIKDWGDKLKEEKDNIIQDDDCFYLEFENYKLGCWNKYNESYNNKPYWGIMVKGEVNNEIAEKIKELLDKLEIENKLEGNICNWYAWNNTEDGYKDFKYLYDKLEEEKLIP